MISRERITRWMIGAYCVLTLPLVFVAVKSEYVRFVGLQMVTNWKGKLIGLSSAYVGDSIAASGRNWGTAFDAINLAGNGYTVWQVEGQLEKAQRYSPEKIFILAGTNDILGRRPFDLRQFEVDYSRLLDRALGMKAEIYVTLIPLTARSEANEMILLANQSIVEMAALRGVPTIDLNPTIAPNGILLPQFTSDGVHFNDAAHSVWRAELDAVMRAHKAEPDNSRHVVTEPQSKRSS